MLMQHILRSFFVIAAALLLQASAHATNTPGGEETADSNVNRPGRDYKDFEMEPSIAGFDPCQAACRNETFCRAWTFVKAGVQGPKAHCWLKKSVPDPVKDDCCVSGVSGVIAGLDFDGDRPGNDYRDFVIGNNNVELRYQVELTCRSACEKDPKCKAWTYVKPEREGGDAHCWLKDAVPAVQKNNCCVSGVAATSGGGSPQIDPAEAADRNPQGKSIQQCEAAFQRNTVRCQARFGGSIASRGACDSEMQQLRGACLSLAAANANTGGGSAGGGVPAGGGSAGGGVPAEWADTLNLHNAKRAMHHTPALAWSASLAAGAQQWADGCSFNHSGFNGYGENLYYGTSATGKDAVEWWYAEVQYYDWNNPIGSYNAGDTDRTKETRHFTQIVWKATTTLGCGIAQCGDRKFVVCRYQPPGNFNANNPGVLGENVPQK